MMCDSLLTARRIRRRALTAWIPLAFFFCAPPARAGVHEDLDAMTRLIRSLRYEEAVRHGLSALRSVTPSDRSLLPPVYRQLATAYFLLGDEPHARMTLAELFSVDPEAKAPDDASPKLR